jgi:flagellar hook assembly protein FlgD
MLSFHQARSEAARVDVFDVAGRHIRTLHEGRLEEGNQQVLWDGRNDKGATVPTGVYFVSLQSESVSAHRKVIRTR